MVVLAAALCTKSGKPLVSRQFVEMPRSRIEGLLASFPKLMSVGKQHTIINTESIRYVYQPMDTLYMVLITNHQSNIVQDIDTLNLFARAATDVCGGSGVHEYIVLEHCFEILCMFDEIVNLGLRENVNMAQLTTIMEMESQEEKIQEAIAKNKEREAKEELKRRAKQFDLQRKEANKHGLGGGGSPFTNSLSTFASTVKSAYSPVESTGASFDYEDRVPSALPKASGSSKSGALKGRGMKLGSKKDKHVPGLLPPGEPELVRQMETQLQLEPAAQASPEVDREDVHVQIEEHISAVINRDGGVEAMEVKGDLTLMVSNPDTSHLVLQVNADSGAGAQIKTHPQVDKKRFQNDNVLALRDASRHFPVNQPVGLLKWRVVSQDEDQLPIVINCWPSPVGDGSTEVNIEYELTAEDLELQDVIIAISLPAGTHPTVGEVDGDYSINSHQGTLDWHLPMIDASNKSGTLEFTVQSENVDAFFPVIVSFTSTMPFCDIDITSVATHDTQEPITFSKCRSLMTDDYRVV